MPENTVNIRVPGAVDLTQYRVQVGDTVQFIEKINSTQTDLENWAQQLTFCAADLQSAVDQIGTRHAEIVQTGTQVAQDKATVQQLRTETGQQRQLAETAAQTATEQAGFAAGAADTASLAASAAGAAKRSASEDAGIASQAATVSTQQRQLAEDAAQQAAQSAVEAGPTNLSVTRTATTVTVQSSTGDDATLPTASTTEAGLMSAEDKQALNGKQQKLVSGSNIKTVNGQSILGGGNITIALADADVFSAIASVSAGGVGSYVLGMMKFRSMLHFGDVVSGSEIRVGGLVQENYYVTAEHDYFFASNNDIRVSPPSSLMQSLAGSWRCMFVGMKDDFGPSLLLGLFLRIA